MHARFCAWFVLAALGLTPARSTAAAVADSFADYNFRRPEVWSQRIDPVTHLAVLTLEAHASIIFIQPKDYSATPDSWHRELWKRLTSDFKARGAATDGRRGTFNTTWGAFDRGDGSQAWLCLYTSLYNGRGEGLLFIADSEGPFRSNLTATNQLVDSITFGAGNPVATNNASPAPATKAAPSPAPSTHPAVATTTALPSAPRTAPAAPSGFSHVAPASTSPAVTQLAVPPPAGWKQQQDQRTGISVFVPPEAPNLNVASFIVFPAISYAGTAEQFHRQTVETTIRGSRLVEPLQGGNDHGLFFTIAHFVSPKGENMHFLIYTARWANRAQAFVFATVRDDLFRRDAAIARAAMQNVVVPTTPNAAALAQSVAAPASSMANSTAPASPSTPFHSTSSVNATASNSTATDYIPVLNYSEPPNFFRGAMRNFAEYTSSQVNFALCVYPFRPYTGDIKAAFQQTLLRDWIDVQYREENVAGPPRITANTTPGADTVLEAHFQENIVGLLSERHRILIIAGNRAAIVDLKARNAQCWQTAFPSASVMLASMRVVMKEGPPAVENGPGPQGAALAGLYLGTKAKFLALGVTDFTGHAPALHYFLFSADGRVFRCYDFPPGGSEAAAHHFDFEAAARQDPGNSGRFAMRGNQLYIKWGGPNDDEILTAVNDPNVLVLDSVQYVRKW